MIRYRIILILLFLTGIEAYSQISEYRFSTISLKEGLSQSTVNCVFQDSKGFLWFGTDDGINRYDGRSLLMMRSINDGKSQEIRGKIKGIDEGAGGKLYVANYGAGLKVYDLNTDNLESFSHSPNDKKTLSSNYIQDILYVNDTTVWLATNLGVSRFDPLSGTFENFSVYPNPGDISTNEGANTLYYDDQGQLWVGTRGYGLLKFINEEKRFIPFVNKAGKGDDLKKNFINGIAGYKDGLLLVTTKSGLFMFDPQTGLFFEHLIHDIELTKIAKDNDGKYWIGSRFNGLYFVDKNEKVQQFRNNPYDPKSFPDYQVVSVYKDNMQSLWVGTRTKGVVQIVLDQKPFTNIYHVPNKPGIPDNSTFAINEDPKGNVWIGTVKGLTIWNRKQNSFKRVSLKLFGQKTNDFSAWSLYFDKNDVVWIGTNKGLVKYDRKKRRYYHYFRKSHDPSSLIYNDIIDIEKDKNGNIWVATPYGVGRLNRKTNKFTNYYHVDSLENTISHSRVWNILSDSKGRLWFCSENGLNQYDFKSHDFRSMKFSNEQFNTDNNLANSLMSITESEDGELWTATQSGIFIYDPDKNDILGYAKIYNDYSKELVYNLLESKNTFWASTNRGLVVIDKKNYKIKERYSSEDGFYSNEFNAGAATKLHDGFMMFGGIAGVTGFYPDKIHKSSFCPPVYLTGISLYGEDVSPENPNVFQRASFIKSTISASSIILTYDEKMVTLKFSALDYTHPKKLLYYYRILPVSDKWISLGNRNFVSFINLNSGDYTLEVKSTNGDGVMCNNIRKLNLEVSPPPWMNWWVITLGILIIALILFLVIRYRVLHLRREKKKLEEIVLLRTKEIQEQRNIANKQRDEIARQKEKLQDFAAELEDKVRKRTRELEEAKLKAEESDRLKSAFLSNMSHEIRTPMNAIMGFSELLLTSEFDNDERETFARMVKSNGDALLKLLNDIIDISMIESGQLKFHFSEVEICSMVNDIFFTFNNSRLYKDKKESVKLEIVSKMKGSVIVNTDKDRLRQVITNLLNNALKFTHEGIIQLGCEEEGKYIKFYIKDTGIGIADEMLTRIFDRFYKIDKTKNIIYGGNGLGLTIVRNIIEALDGEIWVESEVGKGTTFWFTIPK